MWVWEGERHCEIGGHHAERGGLAETALKTTQSHNFILADIATNVDRNNKNNHCDSIHGRGPLLLIYLLNKAHLRHIRLQEQRTQRPLGEVR